jgi:Condensation domain
MLTAADGDCCDGAMFPETVTEQLLIPFAGPGAGTAPLTWGQKAILQDMRETGWTHNASGAHNLPDGSTVEGMAAQLRELFHKHPALRMRLGTDDNGQPCQVVSESGEVGMDVINIADGAEPADAAKFADDLWYSRLLTPFDLHQDWSMQTAIVRHRDVTLYRVLTFDHLVVDGTSIALLMADLGLGDALDRGAPDPRTVQLLELGHREQTPEVRRISDRAMRYWESQLRSIPSLTFGEPAYEGRQGKRFWHGRFASPATYLAVLAIAGRTGTDTSRVLLAIIATAVGRATGVSPLTAKVIVGNRFRPGFAEAIGPLSQNSVVTLDLADSTVDDVIGRARKASVAASKYAYYDPDQLEETIARLDVERGYPARVTCRINDRRVVTRRPAEAAARAVPPTMEQIQAKLGETFLVWDGPLDHLHEQAFITVEDFPETIYLQVIFDMACFTEETVERLLRGVEEVALEAAFDPAVPTRIGPL